MKVIVSKILGDASVMLYNKQGELIHTEQFSGKVSGDHGPVGGYIRNVPVVSTEYGYAKSLYSGTGQFIYEVV